MLANFGTGLLAGAAEELLLDTLLERCRGLGGSRPEEAAHRLTMCRRVRVLNRLDSGGKPPRALNAGPRSRSTGSKRDPLEWYERYSRRIEE